MSHADLDWAITALKLMAAVAKLREMTRKKARKRKRLMQKYISGI